MSFREGMRGSRGLDAYCVPYNFSSPHFSNPVWSSASSSFGLHCYFLAGDTVISYMTFWMHYPNQIAVHSFPVSPAILLKATAFCHSAEGKIRFCSSWHPIASQSLRQRVQSMNNWRDNWMLLDGAPEDLICCGSRERESQEGHSRSTDKASYRACLFKYHPCCLSNVIL